jgi:hypothetical protein
MVLEYVRYAVAQARAGGFERACLAAGNVLQVDDHGRRRRPPLPNPANSAPVATLLARPAGFTRRDRSPAPTKGGPDGGNP